MKTPPEADEWLSAWRRFAEGLSLGAAPGTARAPLEQAGAAFARFAADYSRLSRPSAADSGDLRTQFAAQLNELAGRLVTSAFPLWPSPPGADPQWREALEGWSRILTGIAADTARRFAARLLERDPPAGLRTTFDAWIDAAEAAFQASAHGDAFIAAQARLINEFVRQRARQQLLTEQATKALGIPTRREVDALHDALRALSPSQPAAAAAARASGKPKSSRPRPARARRRKS